MTRAALASLNPLAPRVAGRRWLGYAGSGWALPYIPVHIYRALGGLTTSIGITASGRDFQPANWGASLVILGAALTCLALARRCGELLPRALLRGSAWVGGVLGIAALVHLAWAAGAGLLIPARAGEAAPRLIELGQLGSYRLAGSVPAVLLSARQFQARQFLVQPMVLPD